MITTAYIDAAHFLNEDGKIAGSTRPGAIIAAFLRSVVGWVTIRQAVRPERTNITCRKISSRQRCLGEVNAYLIPDTGEIWYVCPHCGDNGVIRGWEGTSWNRSPST